MTIQKVLQYKKDPKYPGSYYSIFTKHIQLLPKHSNAFYFRPLSLGDFFSSQVIGKNTLDNCVSTMMKQAGYKGYYTNHSQHYVDNSIRTKFDLVNICQILTVTRGPWYKFVIPLLLD